MANIPANIERIIQLFDEKGRTARYKKGELIVRPHAALTSIHLIREGYVRVYTINDRGEEHDHMVYKPLEMFPFLWLLDENRGDVYDGALTDCIVQHLPHEALTEAIASDISLSNALLREVLERYRIYVERVNNLEYKFSRERVIYRLMFLGSRFGVRQPDGSYRIAAPIPQHIIAGSINLSRESVSRELERLKRLDLISYDGAHLILKRPLDLGKEFKDPAHPTWWGLPELKQEE